MFSPLSDDLSSPVSSVRKVVSKLSVKNDKCFTGKKMFL